jgi:hypothetical protein
MLGNKWRNMNKCDKCETNIRIQKWIGLEIIYIEKTSEIYCMGCIHDAILALKDSAGIFRFETRKAIEVKKNNE